MSSVQDHTFLRHISNWIVITQVVGFKAYMFLCEVVNPRGNFALLRTLAVTRRCSEFRVRDSCFHCHILHEINYAIVFPCMCSEPRHSN